MRLSQTRCHTAPGSLLFTTEYRWNRTAAGCEKCVKVLGPHGLTYAMTPLCRMSGTSSSGNYLFSHIFGVVFPPRVPGQPRTITRFSRLPSCSSPARRGCPLHTAAPDGPASSSESTYFYVWTAFRQIHALITQPGTATNGMVKGANGDSDGWRGLRRRAARKPAILGQKRQLGCAASTLRNRHSGQSPTSAFSHHLIYPLAFAASWPSHSSRPHRTYLAHEGPSLSFVARSSRVFRWGPLCRIRAGGARAFGFLTYDFSFTIESAQICVICGSRSVASWKSVRIREIRVH